MQRQLRLGDILDDYCPRERRLTNHAIVAMLGADIKQTRCTTCDTEHEYKQAKVPRQRRKSESPAALYAAVLSGGPKLHGHDAPKDGNGDGEIAPPEVLEADQAGEHADDAAVEEVATEENDSEEREIEEGPVHRPLIRASLPRTENTPPPQRQAPDFTIRQPGGRPQNRFRPRFPRGGQPFQAQGQGNRGNGGNGNGNGNGNVGGGPSRGGMMRQGGGGGRPQGPGSARPVRRDGPGRRRSK